MKAIRVNKYVMPFLAVLTLLGSVWVAKAAGLWQTSGRGQVLLDENGQPDPAGIKGWMTLEEVSEIYGLPLDALYVLIGAEPTVPPSTAMKELEKLVPGMEVWVVREGVAAYRAGLWAAGDGRYVAAGAKPTVVESRPTPAPEPTPPATAEHVPQGQGDGSGTGFVLPQDGSRLPGSEIKGRMTLGEVAEHCQVPLEYLIVELGLPEDVDPELRMRDLASQLGVDVQTVRDVVEVYQGGP